MHRITRAIYNMLYRQLYITQSVNMIRDDIRQTLIIQCHNNQPSNSKLAYPDRTMIQQIFAIQSPNSRALLYSV